MTGGSNNQFCSLWVAGAATAPSVCLPHPYSLPTMAKVLAEQVIDAGLEAVRTALLGLPL